jgi:hypothetical protein
LCLVWSSDLPMYICLDSSSLVTVTLNMPKLWWQFFMFKAWACAVGRPSACMTLESGCHCMKASCNLRRIWGSHSGGYEEYCLLGYNAKLLFLFPIGLLGGCVRAQRFHAVLWASQWELRSTLPFPSCFLYNPKFPASLLLCLPPAFMLVSCSAYWPEDGGNMFLQNIGQLSPDYTVLYPRR